MSLLPVGVPGDELGALTGLLVALLVPGVGPALILQLVSIELELLRLFD